MNSIMAEQLRRNEQARSQWNNYDSHRQRVTELLCARAPANGGRLCVLGAGNCNDLNLGELLNHFAEVHLVDLDDAALEAGVAAQDLAHHPGILIHGGLDVTGVFDQLESVDDASRDARETQLLHDLRLPVTIDVPGPFDVVASVGLLTQLVEALQVVANPAQPRGLDLIQALRLQHLQLLLNLTAPGGWCWLIFEVLSSESCRDLAVVSEQYLTPLVMREISNRNFFTGMNPAVIQRLVHAMPNFQGLVQEHAAPAPWRWRFFGRTYAVCGLGWHRTPQSNWPTTLEV